MKNFVAEGRMITVLSPTNAVSGDLIVIGAIGGGVAATDGAVNQPINLAIEGVFDLKKGADLLSSGTIAKADQADGLIKLAGTIPVGWILESAGPAEPTVKVRLCPSV